MNVESDAEMQRVIQRTFVRASEWHSVLHSTNDRAIELIASESFATPYLVLTRMQTQGRGRGANSWWSDEGALTFSVILDASQHGLPADRWPLLSLTAGLAVCEALGQLLPEESLELKWPNDLFLNKRKASGLLVEVPSHQKGLLVVGIGVNVNNSLRSAPPEIQQVATSVTDVSGRPHDLMEVLVLLLQRLSENVDLLVASPSELLNRWRGRCLLTGKQVWITVGSETVHGHCLGVDHSGALTLRTSDGIRNLLSGVIDRFE